MDPLLIVGAVVVVGAGALGVKSGTNARCPHCGFAPRKMDERLAPVCQKCGKTKRA